MKIAVITGASAGLGKTFFETIMERYPELDEVWIIARREYLLNELAEKNPGRKVRVLPLDLRDMKSFDVLDRALKEQHPDIKVLINNAGFDRVGLFREMKYEDILSMINLNVRGATMISRSCLPYMSKGSYEIISGSIASFIPLPWCDVYSSTKAYLRAFTRALHEEERRHGVNIMYLALGSMDTDMYRENTTGGKVTIFPFLNMQSVTVKALEKAERGAAFYTPLGIYKAYRVFAKIIPSALGVKLTSIESSVPEQFQSING